MNYSVDAKNMEETSNKTKKKIYISLALMVAILACLVIFIVIPMVKKVYAAKDEFEEKKLQFEAIRQDASDAKRFTDLVASLGEDQELVEKAVISEDSIVEFIEEIESIAYDVGNKIEITHKKNEVKRARVPSLLATDSDSDEEKKRKEEEEREKDTVRLELVVLGNYKQFLEFFYKLENMTYVFNVESFNVKATKSSKGLLETEEVPLDHTEGRMVIAFVPKKVQ